MKHTLVSLQLSDFPAPFRPLLQNARVFDSSCSPEARVWYIERDGGYYLKRAPKGALEDEAQMTAYFHGRGLAPAVLELYSEGEYDYLLTARAKGEDATSARYLADPARLCDAIATRLRALHEMDTEGCPIQDHTAKYLARAEKNHAAGVFDASFLPPALTGASADTVWAFICNARGTLESNTLLHGDYCLPNILLDDWQPSGFIDLGNGGIGDRHVDLFWGAWTLAFNLGTDRYRNRFFDAYGRDRIDLERIDLIGAIECFG